MVQAIRWVDAGERSFIELIDQTELPAQEVKLEVRTVAQLVDAIQRLAVRGAPALGVAGALGVALAIQETENGSSEVSLDSLLDDLANARPTAVNLAWGVEQVKPRIPEGKESALRAARELQAADEKANTHLSELGANWLLSHVDRPQLRAVTHCNTGALATSAWGTAYGILHELHNRDRLEMVYADETRPLLQGSRLTSWELMQDGIDHVVQVDGAAASTILRGLVDFAVIGADRITANGDTANKVGSVALALACQRAGIPFIVAAPFSTVDLQTHSGEDIDIEERSDDEVLRFGDRQTAPSDAKAFNPAFDVTPHDLISAIVTERGIYEPATSKFQLLDM
jgi:methylthioribose-1-phosphate isomerase